MRQAVSLDVARVTRCHAKGILVAEVLWGAPASAEGSDRPVPHPAPAIVPCGWPSGPVPLPRQRDNNDG
jgi:hypothetical protein